jgi:alpha-galactosidase
MSSRQGDFPQGLAISSFVKTYPIRVSDRIGGFAKYPNYRDTSIPLRYAATQSTLKDSPMKTKHWPLAVIACLSVHDITGAAGATASPDAADAVDREAAIRTPLPIAAPRINGARVFGTRPGRPFHFQMPVSGERPVKFGAAGLPEGLSIDASSGLITGTTPIGKATHSVELSATNALGSATSKLEIIVGATLALTPPMGWNNYNAFRFRIDDKVIRGQADAMVSSGLIEHGWSYINIDDGWEGVRDSNGILQGNKKFPDMAALGTYIHSRGLKFGIYSSPGELTCGGYPGSLGFEELDAKSYASWGVDYLKYDWCFYKTVAASLAAERQGKLLPDQAARLKQLADEYNPLNASRQRPRLPETTKRMKEIEDEQKRILSAIPAPQRDGIDREIAMDSYGRMGKALEGSGRDVVYSLCQYGMAGVWEWGPQVGGQLWRTSTDITPRWSAFQAIIRRQNGLEKWAGPGRWNDPDMLEIGNGDLTPDEMHTQMTQWCILAAPLLIGTDLNKMDALVKSILTNDEVIAVNQDSLGKQGWMLRKAGDQEIWVKPLSGDRWAVALFNRSDQAARMEFDPTELKLGGDVTARDLWRQRDFPKSSPVRFEVGPHGAEMVSIVVAKP